MDVFTQERKKALQEIRDIAVHRIMTLAKSPLGLNTPSLDLASFVEVQEAFKWPTVVSTIATELEQGKKLQEVFARVAKPQASDLASPRHNGRESAFADVLKALEIAERDFEKTYAPLSKEQLKYWKAKHPIEDQHLEYAWKENNRHHMKESIRTLRTDIEALQKKPSVPALKPPGLK